MKIRVAQNFKGIIVRLACAMGCCLAFPAISKADFANQAWYKMVSCLNYQMTGMTTVRAVTVTSMHNGCDIELGFEVFDATCNGVSNGIIDMTILSGIPPFAIDWDNDGTGDNDDPEDLEDIGLGTYTVTITDADGCTGIGSFDVYEPDAISISNVVTQESTVGGSDGAIGITVSGGTLPYSFDWDNDGTGDQDDEEDISQLEAGIYGVTITDGSGCTKTASFEVEEQACILDLSAAIASANCFGSNDGKLNLTVQGGQGPYQYDWSNDGTGDNDDPQDLHNMAPGNYQVSVTDGTGCTAFASYQITEPSEIFLSASIGDVSIIGGNDGWIDLSPSGSAPPYTYDWSNDGTGDNNDPQDLAALTAGTYHVTVTDEHNCSKSGSYEVKQPLAFDLALRKTLATGQSATVAPGATVIFTIKVYNQGGINATNVLVIDYLPANLSFSATGNFGWVNFGAGPTWFIPSIPAGGVVSKDIKLTVSPNSPLSTLNNYAEITAADDANPNTTDLPVDVDSSPNAFQFDDPGGQPNGPANDVITGNGTGLPGSSNPLTDEDDHDGAAITVFVPSVSLGNLVFKDKDNDGIFNNLDSGIIDVQVKLFKAGADFTANTMDDQFVEAKETNANGEYLFSGLPEGYYFVKLSGQGIPNGYVSSTGDGVYDMDGNGAYEPVSGADLNVDGSDDGSQFGAEITSDVLLLTLGGEPTGGNINTTLDFGLYFPLNLAILGDFVWYDNDLDGQQDLDEPGVQGVVVRLFDLGTDGLVGGGDDNHLDTEITNNDGYYSFINIVPGEHYLAFNLQSLPANHLPTGQNIGNDNTDSDVNNLGLSQVVTLEPGDAVQNLDFGIKPVLGKLGNFVWLDANLDGQQGANEPGIEGVVVQLFDLGANGQPGDGDDMLLLEDITDADGIYGFSDLLPGSYYAVLDLASLPNGHLLTAQNMGNDATDNDADANGVSTVALLSPGENDLSLDFGIYEAAYDLSLSKSLSPGQSVMVDINDLISYTISVTNQGNTAVEEVVVVDHIPAGLIFAPNNPGWTLHSPDSASYTIAGPILPGQSANVQVLMQLQYGASGQELVNRAEIVGVEDANGIAVLDLDSTPDNANPDEDDISGTTIELVPHDPTGWIYCDKTGRIITGGTITVTGPNGIPNGQVNIIHNGSSGYYEFYTDGTPGVYTISYSHINGYFLSSDCAPQPGPVDITGMPDPYILGVDTVNANYLSDISCASNPYYLSFDIEPGDPVVFHNNLPLECTLIGSIVCEDTNFNDQLDMTDAPIPGATVYLYDCSDLSFPIRSTLTDMNGRYTFDALQPGDYAVSYEAGPGFRFISSGNIDQTGFSNCVTLDWGDSETTLAFCVFECPTLDAGADRSHCFSADTSHLDAGLSHGTGTIAWLPVAGLSNPNIANPVASPSANTTYIVSYDDGFGCTDSDTLSIAVGNSTPYLVNSPFVNDSVSCAPLPSETPIFADSCDANLVIISDTTITPLACGFIREITWTASNAIGNTNTFVQTLTVADNQVPSVFASHPFFGGIMDGDTLYADCSQIPSLDSLGFASFDNCSVPVVNFTETVVKGDCDVDGYYELRHCGWTSTDACGNKSSLFFDVIITDNFPPVLSPAPADITVNCGAVPLPATLTANDNCDTSLTVVFTEVEVTDADGCVSQIIRTWTVEDECGNSATDSQTITVEDDTSPTLIGVPANAMLDCSVPVPAAPVVIATDLCDNDVPVLPTQTIVGDPTTGCYSIIRTWRASDNCGNNVQRSQTLVFSDNTPPVLDGVPADISRPCSAPIPFSPPVSATDNCDADVPVTMSQTTNGDPTTGCYSITRTWTATDDCGNTASQSQVITISDTTGPAFSAAPADTTILCEMPIPAPPTVLAFDFCDNDVPVIFTENTNLNTACRVITRTWTASDDCGNTSTHTQTITMVDNQRPVLSATPANATYTCLGEVPPPPTITATDNCDNNAPVLFFTSNIGNPAGCSFQIRRTWAVADDCGNATIWMQTIMVNDNVPPVFATAIPANAVVNCGSPLPAAPTITATDNCDANVVVTMAESYFGDPTAACYLLTRTWTAMDDCGNSVSASQTIQVIDNQPPTFVGLPNNGNANCDNLPGSTVTATDNCDNNVTIVISDQVQSSVLGCATQVVRTWTATDDCGNTRVASRTFNVQNTDGPTITIVEPALLGVQDGDVLYMECDDLPSLTNSSATASADCCGDATVVFHETASGADCAMAGYYAVMHCGWVATDCCGNSDSLFFTVYVIDNTPPAFFGVPDNLVLPAGSLLPAVPVVFAVDNCDNSTAISYNQVNTGPANNRLTTRTWTATDDCGNIGTAVQTILRTTDITAPLIANVPADITIEGPVANLPGGMNDVEVTDDLDDEPTLAYSEVRVGGNCCYTITRRWEATDDFGNTSFAEQTITVEDTQAPVISGNVQDLSLACSYGVVPLPQLTASDNCTTNLALQFTADTTPLACGLQVLRTWVASDECGNTATVSQTIHLEDVEAPVFDPSDAPQLSFFASQNALPNSGVSLSIGQEIAPSQVWSIGNQTMPSLAGIATDNCGSPADIVFKVENIVSVNSGCDELWEVSFQVLDACGNMAAANFSVTANFVDDTAPVFSSLPQNLTVDCGNLPAMPTMTATDGGGSVVVDFVQTQSNSAAGAGCMNEIIRTWTATDACGNSTIAEQTITVRDNAAPVIANVPASIIAACGNVPPAPTDITALDNCAGVVPVLFSENISSSTDCSYSITRTWTATDNCGNSSIKQQYVWVADNTPPAIAASLPAELTVSCDGGLPPAPALAVSDNCDDSPTVELVETVLPGSDCEHSVLRKWTVTDNCGNSAIAQQTIHLVDNTLPLLVNVPADLTVHCGDVPAMANVSATDNCSANVEIEVSVVVPPGCPYIVYRKWDAIDNCGNVAVARQTITILDEIKPQFSTVPANLVLGCGEPLPVPPALAASDQCDNNVVVTMAETVTPTACGEDILRTWTATDDCGNSSSVSQLISRVDNQGPTAVEPIDLTVNCGDLPVATQPVFTDLCDNDLSVVFSETTVPTTCGEDVVRSWTATDDCGNSTTVHQAIKLRDLEAPAMTFANPILAGLSDGDTLVLGCDNNLIFDKTDVLAFDACSGYDVQLDLADFEHGVCAVDSYLMAAKFVWTATDACGNASDLTLNVRVVDNEAPVFTQIPSVVTVNCGQAVPAFTAPEVLGDCSEVAVSFASQTMVTAYGQDIVGIWTAVDDCGNAATTTQTMQVYSIGAAQLLGVPADLTVDLVAGELVPVAPAVSAIDNCSGDPLSLVFEETTQPIEGCNTIIERRWMTVGLNGVTVSATQTITVVDAVQFAASVVADSCNGGNGSVVMSPADLIYAWSDPRNTPFAVGAVQDNLSAGIYTVTATNANGCSTLAEVVVGAACDCRPAVVRRINKIPTPCGEAKGKAVIKLFQDLGNYDYSWTPNLGQPNLHGNGRTQLPAGHYVVEITYHGDANCLTMVEFDILEEGCAKANEALALEANLPKKDAPEDVQAVNESISANNLMTPDGNGQNDYFVIKGLETIPDHDLTVFNALGQLVFRTKHYENNWGGSWGQNNLPSGTYFYLLEDGKGRRYSGHIHILR